MTSDTFTKIVQLAEKNETTSSDVVGYGLASKPISGLSQDAPQRPCSLPCTIGPVAKVDQVRRSRSDGEVDGREEKHNK